jgi:hypothetical protein
MRVGTILENRNINQSSSEKPLLMDSSKRRIPIENTELTREEKGAVLRALGYYQVYLFDKIGKESGADPSLKTESQMITSAIKKIHKTIEDIRT